MTRTTARRMGFTLTEMIIVIAIISVLVAILLPALSKVKTAAERTEAQTEMAQLTTACTTFKQKFGFMPPDELVVPSGPNRPIAPGNPGYRKNTWDGYLLMKQMFRLWDRTGTWIPADTYKDPQTNAPPAGSMNPDGTQYLDGTQVLAYFLGGPELTGWRIDRPNAPAVGANSVHGPFYDFQKEMFGVPTPEDGNVPVGRLLDPWGTPYTYFSTGLSGKYSSSSICPICGGLTPYFAKANKPLNPGMIQIISAGPDNEFGAPSVTAVFPTIFTAAEGAWSPDAPGGDDMSNFHQGVLGSE